MLRRKGGQSSDGRIREADTIPLISMRLFWGSDFQIQALEGDSTTIEELMREQ